MSSPLVTKNGYGRYGRVQNDDSSRRHSVQVFAYVTAMLTECTDTRLTEADIPWLVNTLGDAAHRYYDLAIQLGIRAAWVKRTEQTYSRDAQRCFTEVLTHFVAGDLNPTRQALAAALKNVELEYLSQKLLQGMSVSPLPFIEQHKLWKESKLMNNSLTQYFMHSIIRASD